MSIRIVKSCHITLTNSTYQGNTKLITFIAAAVYQTRDSVYYIYFQRAGMRTLRSKKNGANAMIYQNDGQHCRPIKHVETFENFVNPLNLPTHEENCSERYYYLKLQNNNHSNLK